MQHPLLPQPPGRHGSGAPSVLKGRRGRGGAPAPVRRDARRGNVSAGRRTVPDGIGIRCRRRHGLRPPGGLCVSHARARAAAGAPRGAAGMRIRGLRCRRADCGRKRPCGMRHRPRRGRSGLDWPARRGPRAARRPAYNQTHANQRPSNRLPPLRDRPRASPRHRRARDGPLGRDPRERRGRRDGLADHARLPDPRRTSRPASPRPSASSTASPASTSASTSCPTTRSRRSAASSAAARSPRARSPRSRT